MTFYDTPLGVMIDGRKRINASDKFDKKIIK